MPPSTVPPPESVASEGGSTRVGLLTKCSNHSSVDAPEIGLQAISKALLNSAIARFFAFQERSSGFDYIGAGAVRLPSAREQRREEVAAYSAAAVAVPRATSVTHSTRGDVPPYGDVVET